LKGFGATAARERGDGGDSVDVGYGRSLGRVGGGSQGAGPALLVRD
jgi:hypothetical protein